MLPAIPLWAADIIYLQCVLVAPGTSLSHDSLGFQTRQVNYVFRQLVAPGASFNHDFVSYVTGVILRTVAPKTIVLQPTPPNRKPSASARASNRRRIYALMKLMSRVQHTFYFSRTIASAGGEQRS